MTLPEKLVVTLGASILIAGWLHSAFETAILRRSWIAGMVENDRLQSRVVELEAQNSVYFWDHLKAQGADLNLE